MGEWKNGFDAMPDATVNLQEFYAQYHKNKAQWDAAFKWLAETFPTCISMQGLKTTTNMCSKRCFQIWAYWSSVPASSHSSSTACSLKKGMYP